MPFLRVFRVYDKYTLDEVSPSCRRMQGDHNLVLDDIIVSMKTHMSSRSSITVIKRKKIFGQIQQDGEVYKTKANLYQITSLAITRETSYVATILNQCHNLQSLKLEYQKIDTEIAEKIVSKPLVFVDFQRCEFSSRALHFFLRRMLRRHPFKKWLQFRPTEEQPDSHLLTEFEVESFPRSRTRIHFTLRVDDDQQQGAHCSGNGGQLRFQNCTLSSVLPGLRHLPASPDKALREVLKTLRKDALDARVGTLTRMWLNDLQNDYTEDHACDVFGDSSDEDDDDDDGGDNHGEKDQDEDRDLNKDYRPADVSYTHRVQSMDSGVYIRG